jgi:hypothetical protein
MLGLRVYPYFLLIGDQLRVRPTHGTVVCGDDTRHRIDNDEHLRAWVLDLAGQIRAARREISMAIPVNPKPGQCRPCDTLLPDRVGGRGRLELH